MIFLQRIQIGRGGVGGGVSESKINKNNFLGGGGKGGGCWSK